MERKLYFAMYFVFYVDLKHFSNVLYIEMMSLENNRCGFYTSLKCETQHNNTEYFIIEKEWSIFY